MRRTLYFIPITLTCLGLLYYLVTILSPFNTDGDLDTSNLLVVISIFTIFLGSIISMFFAVIDKLFFKKFYEAPNYPRVIKYASFLSVEIGANLYIKIEDNWNIVVLILSLVAFLSILLLDFVKAKQEVHHESGSLPN